jgi:PAS domain S-box-containing protein
MHGKQPATMISSLCEPLRRAWRRLAGSERERVEGALREAEEALRESEHQWRSLTEALPQLVWSAKPDGACDYFSTQWTQHTGVPERDLLGWRWMETLHPDDREPTRQLWTASVAGRGPYDVEYRVRRSDGVYRWFKTRGVPIRDGSGNIVKWFGTCTDITDLRQTEEALRFSEQRYRSLVEAAAAIVWTLPPSGLADNSEEPGWTAFTGQSTDQMTGWGWLDAIHPDDRAGTVEAWSAAVATQSFYRFEYRVRRHDGEYRNMLIRGVPIRAADGELREWFGTCIDITDLKRLEGELLQAKEAAEAANRAKDEFLANVSHEIRTPMNAILGMTDLVLDTPLSEDQRRCLKTVKSGADSLLGMINDLLDFSKIEAGKLELEPAGFSLRAALGDTLRVLSMRAHMKGLELAGHVQPDVPDALIGDAGRLRQVLLNLIGNAIKFTEKGEVVVRVEADGNQPSNGQIGLRFDVRDTGIGISPDKQKRIFEAFEQEDTSTTRKYGGTGLGLTIAARLVALMGGTITVDSEPGRGSTFAFTAHFACQPCSPEPVTPRPPVSLGNLPVLVVDDNATNRHILEEWLRGWQMEAVAVADGRAALDALWHRAANGRPYALVLLDARMPDTDGLTVAAMIRERTELAATSIILLTSGERSSDLARIRELRIDAHLLKPVQQEELLETIYLAMSRATEDAPRASPPIPAQPGTPPPGSAVTPLHILVAEDNELSAQVLEQLLTRQGHTVRLTNNGREALALAQEGDFDLLLLDIHMPELDGFHVVRAVREREQITAEHLPVIALTARSRKEDRERCLAAGMDDFLTKPVRPADLWPAIDRVMRNCSPRASLSAHLLDASVVLAACGGDAALLAKMCRSLEAQVPEHLEAIRDALSNRDATRLREAAHKCCGTLSEFSTVAGDLAGTVEDLAAGAQLDKAAPIAKQLDATARELVQQVRGLPIDALRQAVAELVRVPQQASRLP